MLAGEYIQTREEIICVAEEKAAYIVRPPKLLDRLREALRSRHYSRRTEVTYCHWVKTTMIHTHVLNCGPAGVRSPVEGL